MNRKRERDKEERGFFFHGESERHFISKARMPYRIYKEGDYDNKS
jgi:hypothetical protein